MAISGQQIINIGVENQVAGSDSLNDAWHKTQNNFTTLFDTSSPYNNFVGNSGIDTSSDPVTGTVTITNTGVTSITGGSGVTVNGATGNVIISVTMDANGNVIAGVTNVAVESSTLNVTGGPIVSSGIITVDLPMITPGPTFAAGEYVAPTLTVDNYGRIIAIDNTVSTGTVTSVAMQAVGNGLSVTGSPITSSGIIQIRNTGVTKLVAGTGITLSGTTGDVTITSTNISDGTVKRIDFSSNALVITGSPVTTTGNITIDLPNNVDVLGNLSVAGDANVTGNLTVIGTLYAPDGFSADDATYTGNIVANVVTANIELNGGNIDITGNILVGTDANITGNLYVQTDATITGNISAVTFTGNVVGDVDGIIGNNTPNSATFTDIGLTGNITTDVVIQGDFTAEANANVGINLGVAGNVDITASANIGFDLSVTGNATITGNVEVSTMGDLVTGKVVASPFFDANVVAVYGDAGTSSGYLWFINDSGHYNAFICHPSTANTIYILPQADGSSGSFMKTNGAGQLSFTKSVASSSAPATASSAGTAGQVSYDSSYVYVCVATNTWKRAALSTW